MGADLRGGNWSGAMRLLRWGLLWLLVGFSPAAAQIPEDIQQLLHHRGHALLIGVSDYKTGWDKLPSVKDDLHDLKAGLAPYFETVDTVQSPTVAELRNRMHDFLMGRWNRPDERLFVYYSGHGFTDFNQSSRQNDGYITGRDTPLHNQTDGMAETRCHSSRSILGAGRPERGMYSWFSTPAFRGLYSRPRQLTQSPAGTSSTVSRECWVNQFDIISPRGAKTKR